MMLRPRPAVSIALLTVAAAASWAATPGNTEWKDVKGASFRGEPVETLGPMAMFRTGATSSKFLPMRMLSLEDCVRFHHAIASRPPRSGRWSDAKGEATRELIGRLRKADRGQQLPFDFAAVPEPELLIVLYGGRRDRDAEQPHFLLDNLAPFINRVQRVYPDRVAAVVWSTRQSNLNVRSLPNARTWLVADPEKQSGMRRISQFATGVGFVMVLMTREGIPLLGGPANDVGEVMQFVDRASDVLWQLNPANPRSARDRLHYLRATRPVQFAEAKVEPVLLIDPLRTDALRERGVTRVDAKFEVAADGSVAQIELLPTSQLPASLSGALTEALRRGGIFLPAIDHGVPVAATYSYALKIEPVDPKLAADAAWVKGEARIDVPLKQWLALKPVRVPEQVFSMIDHIGPDGTVMLKAVTAGKSDQVSTASQVNSFNSDWFADAGAASVRPVAGTRQEVDGEKLVWKRLTADHGRVDFLEGASYNSHDYCIGYAWTEFDSPDAADAWLGIGSDDGVKIWLNGELVNDKWVARTSRLDDDVVPLRLKPGKNQLLIKIQNVRGRWCFTCRMRVRGA
ncbi:MAG: hypothetical protein Q7S40_28710 [Opitutaceae bacterium]|nr:hypothetical protein [Opitutaceae bacterium]